MVAWLLLAKHFALGCKTIAIVAIVAAVATVFAVAIAAPIGLAFDGTLIPILIGTLACSALAWGLMRQTTVVPA